MTKLLIALAFCISCSTSSAQDDSQAKKSAVAVDSRPPAAAATDDMIDIPEGFYMWDTNTCNTKPDYERNTQAFRIDRNVVKCDDYRACVKAKRCPSYGKNTCTFYSATVPREAAQKYCTWRGAELPSTGQWQKAARKDGRFFPNGYVFDLLQTCKPGTVNDVASTQCFFASPYGMIIRMLQSKHSGEWTRNDSCTSEVKPLAISLEYRLNELTTPLDPYQEFRCVR